MSGSASAGVCSGSSRQSTVTSHSAGITFRWCDASIIVGESVSDEQRLDERGQQRDAAPAARASASSSGGASPSTASRNPRASGISSAAGSYAPSAST